jgi:stage V sporulation protein AD
MVEGLLLASIGISGGAFARCAAIASSHNSSAERQYRTPLGYGGQRSPTAQWTVTGAAAFLLSHADEQSVQLVNGAVGIVRDMGINDSSNMGAAMAPAAADTLCRFSPPRTPRPLTTTAFSREILAARENLSFAS